MTEAQKEAQELKSKILGKLVTSVFVLPVIMWLFPSVVPFSFFELWNSKNGYYNGVIAAWPIYLWGTGITFLVHLFTRNDRWTNLYAEDALKEGTVSSLLAGVWEELAFRWLFFLNGIVAVKIGNFFFFGFLGFGIAQWVHLNIFGPIANWTTFGALQPYLFHPATWAVGASMLATNAFFRDGHKYLGFTGWINSWFIGMFLFWLMFQYGLPAAITAHFIYDLLITIVVYVDAAVERKLGWV